MIDPFRPGAMDNVARAVHALSPECMAMLALLGKVLDVDLVSRQL